MNIENKYCENYFLNYFYVKAQVTWNWNGWYFTIVVLETIIAIVALNYKNLSCIKKIYRTYWDHWKYKSISIKRLKKILSIMENKRVYKLNILNLLGKALHKKNVCTFNDQMRN